MVKFTSLADVFVFNPFSAIALLRLFSVVASAQQDPYYTHFKDVMQAYNPAAAGHQWGEICISGLTHHQWRDYGDDTKARGTDATEDVGLANVAPVTYNINVNTVFKIGQGNHCGRQDGRP